MSEIFAIVAQATTPSSFIDAPLSSSVSESDAARLSDLLSSQGTQAAQPNAEVVLPDGVQALDPAFTSISGSPKLNMGDSILKTLDAVGRSYKEKTLEVNKMMAPDNTNELSVQDMMRIQVHMIDTSMQVDMFSKLVSKGVQHIDQLTKLQ